MRTRAELCHISVSYKFPSCSSTTTFFPTVSSRPVVVPRRLIVCIIMSGDVSMLSDDDRPILAKPGPSNQNGNGHAAPNGKHDEGSSELSDDDDLPLVSVVARADASLPRH